MGKTDKQHESELGLLLFYLYRLLEQHTDEDHPLATNQLRDLMEQDTHQIIVIGVAAIVPHNAMADSLMADISMFIEENTEAEILDEKREMR